MVQTTPMCCLMNCPSPRLVIERGKMWWQHSRKPQHVRFRSILGYQFAYLAYRYLYLIWVWWKKMKKGGNPLKQVKPFLPIGLCHYLIKAILASAAVRVSVAKWLRTSWMCKIPTWTCEPRNRSLEENRKKTGERHRSANIPISVEVGEDIKNHILR